MYETVPFYEQVRSSSLSLSRWFTILGPENICFYIANPKFSDHYWLVDICQGENSDVVPLTNLNGVSLPMDPTFTVRSGQHM